MRTTKTKRTAVPRKIINDASPWPPPPIDELRAEPKTAPAVTQPGPDPNDYQAWNAALDARMAALEDRAKLIRDLLGDISGPGLQMMQTVRLINAREAGSMTPVETFIDRLLLVYSIREESGQGMTLDQIEDELGTLRADYRDAIEQAHFIASRYPKTDKARN